MKSLKKTLVLLVVFAMIFSTIAPAFAATDVDGLDCEDQVTRMEALGIINGFEDGTFKPTETITRAQMAKIICLMTGVTESLADASKDTASKFSDVAAGAWYTGYVNIASNNGIIAGFPDGTFRPDETLTMNQVLTLCVKALGRGGYVDKMGTWPANYVTEAARLNLLKDVKSATVANRGNVAVICWNTLNTKTWYVTSEDLDGKVSLGQEGTKTLLAINYSDFTTDDGAFKEVEDIEIVRGNIDNRQLKLDANVFGTTAEVKAYDFAKVPSKNKDEKSYKDGDTVFIYVPENVYEDLDALRNKSITLILGEDNIAVLVLVEDDVVETAFLTKYDDNKITVDGVSYKLAAGYDVTLNDVEMPEYVLADQDGKFVDAAAFAAVVGTKYTKVDDEYVAATTWADGNTVYYIVANQLDDALDLIDPDMDFKDIGKAIEATVTLDEDNKVEAIELFVSADLANTAEVLVTKTRETSSTYTIYTTGKNITWDVDDEDDLDFPKVYVDGVKGELRDIEAGNVLTIITDATSDNDIEYNEVEISKIYASTETVTGEATKVKKSNNAVTIDGTVYAATNTLIANKMSKDELKDNKFTADFVAQDVLDNDEVTLYLNIFGEYVAVLLDETSSDYTFGVVTFVSSNITWEGDDEEVAVRNIKVLLPDGKKTTYKLKVDTSDDDITTATQNKVIVNDDVPVEAENFIMFESNADKVIDFEDGDEITVLTSAAAGAVATSIVEDYVIATGDNVDDEDFIATYSKAGVNDKTISAEYDANTTVIFNTAEKEIVTKWKSILTNNKTEFAANTFMIFEDEDEDTPLYIIVNIPETDYSASDSVYAIVENSAYQTGNKNYVDFVNAADIEVKAGDPVTALTDIDGWLVEYAMSSSRITEAYKLINAGELVDAKDTKTLANYVAVRTPSVAIVDTIAAAGTVTIVNEADFVEGVTDAQGYAHPGTYVFTRNAINDGWTLNGVAADVTNDYGMTVGPDTFVAGETITVTLSFADTAIAWGETAPTKVEQIELDEVKISSSGKITLVYKETDHDNNNATEDVAISSVKMDKDIIKVYDLRNGEVETTTISAIQAEVADGESVYAIPAYNSDVEDDGANLLFIVK